MVSLSQRMRKLQTKLLAMRLGSGAYILPKDIKRIHMRFAPKLNNGHMGPRKFWRHELVRLKYHNPAVSMTTDRTIAQDQPATMSIHYAPKDASQSSDSATSSPAPVDSTATSEPASDHAPTERVETIEMKHRSSAEILEEFVRRTNAFAVEATEQDKEDIRALENQRVRSTKDSALSQEVRAKVKREQELLEQARGDMAQAA